MSIEELQNLLIKSGFDPRIRVIGKTPVLHTERGEEIQQWIYETGFDGNFIIIDDDSDMCHLIDRLVQPNTYIGIYNV